MYKIIKHKNAAMYKVGEMITITENGVSKNFFDTVFTIHLENKKNIGHRLNYDKLYQVLVVGVKENQRGRYIAKNMYRWLLKHEKYTLLGDEHQFFGARKLWSVLSKDSDIRVDIVDLSEDKVLFRNVTLHQGKYDKDFDVRLWGYTESERQKHIRSVLINI